MPQQSLLPDHPPMTRLQVTIRSYPHTKFPDEVDVSVAVATGSDDLKTRQVLLLRGLEADFLNTIVGEVVTAYMYGERPQDVSRAALDVHKQAKAHSAAYEM